MEKKIGLGLFFIVIFVDQLLKYFFFENNLYTLNTGISFSLLSENLISIVLPGLVLFIVFMTILKAEINTLQRNILITILGAGCSNLLDRLRLGGVIDYIKIGNLPIFNLADLIIFISAIIFLVIIIKDERTNNNSNK